MIHTGQSQRTEEIKDVAAKLFEASGYSATTMTDIANAVGILPGSLYHHFTSKEDLAVSILEDLENDLGTLAAKVAEQVQAPPHGAEDALRMIAREVVTLSMRSGAALRLYSYAAPSVASPRFRAAVQLQAPTLEKVWGQAVEKMFAEPRPGTQDTTLLRLALHRLTLQAVINTAGNQSDADRVARELCDLLLDGLATDCPSDADLDASPAMHEALEAIAGWPPQRKPDGTGSREDIVAAAKVEFSRRGYDATTVRNIADAAGVRMGTLYRRIESKEDLLQQILGDYTDSLEKAVRSVLTTGTSEAESLDAMARVFVEGTRHFRTESNIVKFGWQRRDKAADPFNTYYNQTRARLRLLESVITRGLAKGSIRKVGTANKIAVQIRSIIWLRYDDFSEADVTRAHQFIRNSLLRGFKNGA
ncbi:TetR/AcrR family transcriptional regulator [Rhodococcus koreensis]